MQPNVLVKINALDQSKAAFDSLKRNMEGVRASSVKVRDRIEAMGPAFQKMAMVGTAAFAGITAIAGKSIEAYAEVERAQRQLENAIINVSKGTADQVAKVNELTAALEKKAGVDADSLNMGVAQLSTFGLSTDAVINLTKSLADLTVNQSGVNAGSEDYIQSANNIAKALNGQFGILEKSGIRFNEAQKNLILFGTESEKVAALQEGFAQNLRETTDTVAGVDLASAKMRRTLENISENLGKALVPAFVALTEKIQPVIERFAEWSEKNPELLGKLVLVAGAIAGLAVVLGGIGLVLPAIITGFSLVAGAIGLISLPVLAVIAALAALGVAIYYLYKNWDTITAWMRETFAAMGEGVRVVGEMITAVFSRMWGLIKDIFWSQVNFIVGLVASLFDFLVPGWAGMLTALLEKATVIWASISEFFRVAFEAFTLVFSTGLSVITGIWDRVWNTAKTVFETVWESIKSIFDSVVAGLTSSMETLTKPIQKVIDLAEKALSLAGGVAKGAGFKISSVVSSILSRGSSITGKANGGPVSGGTPYVVGEVGPELFVPGTSGKIIPNNALQPAAAGGAPIYVTITGNSFMGEKDMAERLLDKVVDVLKQNQRV